MSTHIFLNFVPRLDRPYDGIIAELSHVPNVTVIVIDLPEALFEVTKRVEYSSRRLVRFFYYGPIYRYLESEVKRAVADQPGSVFVYTSDEGIWTEYIKQILRTHVATPPVLVNVQHGLHYLEKPTRRSLALRKAINALCRLIMGYPIYGFGFGGSACDIYLVYGEGERDFLKAMGRTAVVAVGLIKVDFFEQIRRYTPDIGPQRSALFALQPISRSAKFTLTEADFYNRLLPVAKSLARQYDYRLVYRTHPGMDYAITLRSLKRAGLLEYGEIQDSSLTSITQAVSNSEIVLSHSSTVLLEAFLTGRIAVQLLENKISKQIHMPINFLSLEPGQVAADTARIAKHPVRVRQTPATCGITSWVDYLGQELGRQL